MDGVSEWVNEDAMGGWMDNSPLSSLVGIFLGGCELLTKLLAGWLDGWIVMAAWVNS